MFLFVSFKMANFIFVFVACALFVVVVSEMKGNPRFVEDVVDLTVVEGSNVTLPCVVENLGDYRILWFNDSYNHQHMPLSRNENIITKNPRVSVNKNYWLEIQNVKLEDRGQYLCYVDTQPAMTQTRLLKVVGVAEGQRIRSNQISPVLSEKEIEDFTDSEYIPVGDKENVNVTDDLDESSSPPQSTLSPEVKVSVSNSEREFKNTINEQSSSILETSSVSNEKMLSSLDDTSTTIKVTTDKLSSTPNEKQHSSTEDSNISHEISTSSSTDASTNSGDASSTSNVSTSSDDSSSSSDVASDKSEPSTGSDISISPTSGITSSSDFSSTVTDLLNTNSDSTSGKVSLFTTPDATPPVSKDVSTINSTSTDLSSSTVVSVKSTASTEELVSNTEITITTSEASPSGEPKPSTDKSTTETEESSLHSSPITSTLSEVTTEHLHHITLPGLKKIKLGLAITFLTIAVIAMTAIIIYMIKMRKPSIPYEELSLVP